MSRLVAVLAFALSLAAASVPEARIQYFSHVRPVQVAAPGRQNYAIIDESIWNAARPDLGDVRLYAAGREVPYALVVQQRTTGANEYPARILNAGRVNGMTEFVADLSGAPEYNEVRLKLADNAKDFVARARIEGMYDLHQRRAVDLGAATIFDFSGEKLGCNYSLKLLRLSAFRYLRVTIPEISLEQVLGATVADTRERSGAWVPVSISPTIQQSGRTTVVSWSQSDRVPLARVGFIIDPANANFRRTVEIQNSAGQIVASGEISRVHLERNGKSVEAENLVVDMPETRASGFKVVIQNGDDAPLRISEVKALALERRLYFAPEGDASLSLYFGDSGLTAPIYDYAKLFRAEENAPIAMLGPTTKNPAYTGRPDARPWTERHPALLWTALVLAVAGLGAVALREIKKG